MQKSIYVLALTLCCLSLLVTPLVTNSDDPTTGQISVPTWDGTLRRIRVPILMYHYVRPYSPNDDPIKRSLSVEPDVFLTHLDYLKKQKYSTISLYDLDRALLDGTDLPGKAIILTFDDGYIDHYVTVFPYLLDRGFIGTFFVITGLADANHQGYLSWSQIQEMAAAGMSMESHTKNHVDLLGEGYELIVYEVLGSVESLEAYIGVRPRMFAYPVGHYDSAVLTVMSQVDTWRAVTTQSGNWHTTDNRLELTRVRITGNLRLAEFVALLGEEERKD